MISEPVLQVRNKAQNSDSLINLLALSRLPGVGPAKIKKILESYQTPDRFFQEKGFTCPGFRLQAAAVEQAREFVTGGLSSFLGKQCVPDLHWLEKDENQLITIFDLDYPESLRNIPQPPPLLYVKGNSAVLSKTQLAVVGSRTPTADGFQNASSFSSALSQHGVVVTSGLAKGVDGAAHKGVLKALSMHGSSAPTLAVVGNGLDQIYPRNHAELTYRIIESGGAVVSEFPIGTTPHPGNFPRRNRIISGLSLGTLVIEATLKSGSLITARYALEQGKEVFAIPGSINSPQSRGTHHLIRQGAKLVESMTDILEELPFLEESRLKNYPDKIPVDERISEGEEVENQGRSVHLTEKERLVYDCLTKKPKAADLIVVETGMLVREVTALLSILEVRGVVKWTSGGYFR